jgi:hypothetical protein
MFKATMITLSLVLSSIAVRAQVLSAENFGLTPETGYVEATNDSAQCRAPSQILYRTESYMQFISKCDGSNIGWVERTVNGADLKINVYSTGEVTFNIVSYQNRDSAGQSSEINIYTCGRSRDDEFGNETIKPSEDEEGNLKQLQSLKMRKANFKIQLFYNQYVLSGKCIGHITEL